MSHPRLHSQTFKSFPWFTTTIVDAHNLLEIDPPLEQNSVIRPLLETLHKCESRTCDEYGVDQYAIFREEMLGLFSIVSTPKNRTEAKYKILLAYRLLDVFLYVHDYPLRTNNPSLGVTAHRKLPLGVLNDLPDLIVNAHNALHAHLLAAQKGEEAFVPTASGNPLVRLYSYHSTALAKRDVQNTIINLSGAAIHMGLLFK
ncbi:hypothetical protein H0H93_004405, partial [Arthromyces matolae]